jgi:hypothetical protein
LIVFIILSQTDHRGGAVDSKSMEATEDIDPENWERNKLPEWAPPESEDSDVILMVGLFIRATDTAKRDELRATIFKHQVFSGKNPRANIRFIIGHPQDNDMEPIKSEMMEKQDMVLLPFTDMYNNLGIKTQLFFKCYSNPERNYKFIMKLDDDTYYNFDYMIKYLDEHVERDGRKYWYIGAMYYGSCPSRNPDNKYCVPVEEYPEDVFPTYASGGAYILSKPLARKVTLMRCPIVHIEDANVGYRIQRAKEASIFDDEVQYVDITEVYADGQPIFYSQIETVDQLKLAYARDLA